MKTLSIFFCLLIAHSAFCQSSNETVPKDLIDLRQTHLDEKSERLVGYCRFYANQLLTPDECQTAKGEIVSFPTLFNDKNKMTSLGYATYKLSVLLPKDAHDVALALPSMYSSYKLWMNNKVVATNGVVAKTAAECKPQWHPQTVSINVKSDTLSLVLQIANFHHAKGGIADYIYVGETSSMKSKNLLTLISVLVEAIVLFIIGLFFLFVFVFKGTKKRAPLYFSLLCITWGVRALFANTSPISTFYPDFDWTITTRIEYITLYLMIIWSNLCLSSLFVQEANVFVKYGLLFCSLLFIVFSLSSPPQIFTQGINIYLITIGLLLIYGMVTVVRAWINERQGSTLLSISAIITIHIFGYDVFVYEGFSSYNPLIFSIGYMSVFILMGFALATNLGLIKSKPSPTTKLTYEDFYKNQ